VVAKILKVTPMSLLAYAPAIFKASPRALLVSVAGELPPRADTLRRSCAARG
jgi:hypothetical protein